MALIRVVATINPLGLDPAYVDLTDDTGLTEEGFWEVYRDLLDAGLENIEFEVVG